MILPMPVISNTSPLWNLASIERLDLLQDQFPDIRIPRDVWRELQIGDEHPEVARIQRAIDAQWITIESRTNPHLQRSFMLERVGWGEERTPTWVSETSVCPGLCWGSFLTPTYLAGGMTGSVNFRNCLPPSNQAFSLSHSGYRHGDSFLVPKLQRL
uniref:Uncharacterized protein n=1 Tax=Candidatus Kentrum sp. DK TaxID=2126562 RepID=A0A450SQT2_9GAMM|nr:MAG: hypothetical protein BECKDK2373B_GA0170837_105720 [Candidatus Kentron sp. DK]VFJ61500.1 MAG: hypothetical protein BECKDK2373C_GA0170839_108917 [Candidatus Kentron sp. DK]